MWKLKQIIGPNIDQRTGEIKSNKLQYALDKATVIRSNGRMNLTEIQNCRIVTASGVVTSVAGGAVLANVVAKGVFTGVCLFTAGFIITDMVFPYNKLYNFKLKQDERASI